MMQSTEESYVIDIGRSELSNVRSSDRQPRHDRDEEDAVWILPHHAATYYPQGNQSCLRRRKKTILWLVGLALIIVVIFLSGSGRKSDDSNAADNNENNQVSTTQSPFTTTLSVTSTVADSTTPSTTPAATTAFEESSSIIASNSIGSMTAFKNQTSLYNCRGDRMNNNYKLETNHFICSTNGRYRFGMDETGSLIFADDAINKTLTIYNGTKQDYFLLKQDATFTVYNASDAVVWEAPSSDNVSLKKECLHTKRDGVYDCPYLHLHNGHTLVLNYVNESGWQARSATHVYSLGQCSRENFVCE